MRWLLASLAAVDAPTEQSPWLHDEFVETYARWREESASVRLAYERWKEAEPDMEPLAFAAYLAALDREGRAADEYRACADRVAA
jgi:hypothetical protein